MPWWRRVQLRVYLNDLDAFVDANYFAESAHLFEKSIQEVATYPHHRMVSSFCKKNFPKQLIQQK